MQPRLKIKLIIIAFFLIGHVTGCVYLRFLKVKSQITDFNKNFKITEENGLSLIFLNPVLKKEDVVWLMGTEPTVKKSEENKTIWIYELKKRYRDITTEKGFDITLKSTLENNKLTALTLPERFIKYLPKSVFEKIFKTFGESNISKKDKQVSSKYEGADQSEIPLIQDILAALGTPYYDNVREDERIFVYRYKILSPDINKKQGIKITYNFNKKTEILKSVKANIKGHKVFVEFTKSTD